MDKENFQWKENTLIHNYTKRLCRQFGSKLYCIGYDFDDLMQECWITYYKCLKSFKGQTTRDFMVFYSRAIKNRIFNLLRKNKNELKFREKLTFVDEINFDEIGCYVDLKYKLGILPKKLRDKVKIVLTVNTNINSPKNKLVLQKLKNFLYF